MYCSLYIVSYSTKLNKYSLRRNHSFVWLAVSLHRPLSLTRGLVQCSESNLCERHVTRTSTNVWLRTARARSPSTPSCPSSEVSAALWRNEQRGNSKINHSRGLPRAPLFFPDDISCCHLFFKGLFLKAFSSDIITYRLHLIKCPFMLDLNLYLVVVKAHRTLNGQN